MQKSSIRPLIILFVVINALIIVFRGKLHGLGFDADMLIIGHVILFAMTAVSMTLLLGSLKASNTAAFLRGVYGSFLMKFFVVAVTVLVYAFLNRERVNKQGIFTLMFLYLVYTFIEIRSLLEASGKSKEHA